MNAKPVIVVAGVSGVGKTTIAKALAGRLGLPALDADDLHDRPAQEKMAAGVPLDEDDRDAWLTKVGKRLHHARARNAGLVCACSALRRSHRDALRAAEPTTRFVLLHADRGVIRRRLRQRPAHFFPPILLESQLSALELPEAGERVMVVDAAATVADILLQINQIPYPGAPRMNTRSTDIIGIAGTGHIGRGLALNFAGHAYHVGVYDPDRTQVDRLVGHAVGGGNGARRRIQAYASAEELAKAASVVALCVPDRAVDDAMKQLLPVLEQTDGVLIDMTNMHQASARRRQAEAVKHGVDYLAACISGGPRGARLGPAIFAGGSERGKERVWPMLRTIAATAGPDRDEPCCLWTGSDATAAARVKTEHNAIEYCMLQALGEIYALFRAGLRLSHRRIYDIFALWQQGPLSSYLLEIARDAMLDTTPGGIAEALDDTLDVTQGLGTGLWAAQLALEAGMPAGMVASAVDLRQLSQRKKAREQDAVALGLPTKRPYRGDPEKLIAGAHDALLGTILCAYAQGFERLREATCRHGWPFTMAEAAGACRAGCVIRADLLQEITAAYERRPNLANVLRHRAFRRTLARVDGRWHRTVAIMTRLRAERSILSAALDWYDLTRTPYLHSVALVARLRYRFGRHPFYRLDGEPFDGLDDANSSGSSPVAGSEPSREMSAAGTGR